MKMKYAIIKMTGNLYPGEIFFVGIDPKKPEFIYWNGTRSYCQAKYEILENMDETKFPDVDDFERHYIRKYHHPQKAVNLKQSAGWLSPEGHFYECQPVSHLDLAFNLSVCLYNSFDNERILEEKGWLKIYLDGLIAYDRRRTHITQKQLDTLSDLSQAGDGTWNRKIMNEIKNHEL